MTFSECVFFLAAPSSFIVVLCYGLSVLSNNQKSIDEEEKEKNYFVIEIIAILVIIF